MSTSPAFSVPVRPAPVVEGDARAAQIMAIVDKAFLTEMGWDPERGVLSPPDGHRLVVRPVCQVDGCSTTATNARRICFSCQARLAAAGLGDDQLGLLPPPGRSRRAPAACVVAGCARERVSGPARLCRAHNDQRRCLGVEVDAFVAHPDTVGLPALGPCLVAACPRQRRHPAGCYCEAHQLRSRHARRADPALDELRWRQTEPAVSLGGQVSLRGLDSLVVAQVLYGLSQRCLAERVQTKEADLRAVIDDLRRQQVHSLDAYVIPEQVNLGFVGLAHSLAAYARRALATPESEVAGDDWDLKGLRAHRHAVVRPDQPAVVAPAVQIVGGRRPAETANPSRTAHQRRARGAPPHRLRGHAVGIPPPAPRPR
jgi:hypothetical protein